MTEHSLFHELLEDERVISLSRYINEQKQVNIHQLKFPEIPELKKEAYAWAKSLFANTKSGDTRPEPNEYQDRLVLRHPDGFRIRTYYASGYLEYHNLARTFAGKTEISNTKEADLVVQEFASKHSLWPIDSQEQIQFEDLRFVKSQGNSSKGDNSEIITNNVIVSYKRVTNGLRWIGSGSKITAMIEGKDIVAFDRHWRQIMPKHIKVSILPVEQALENMINRLSCSIDNKTMNKGDISLEHVDFGYYAAGRRKLQRFLQPVYMFIYRPRSKFTTATIVDVQLAHNESFENIIEYPDPEIHNRRSNKNMFRQK